MLQKSMGLGAGGHGIAGVIPSIRYKIKKASQEVRGVIN